MKGNLGWRCCGVCCSPGLRKAETIWQRLSLLSPLLVGVLFVVWRTIGYSIIGIEDSYGYTDNVQLTPFSMLYRLILGYQVMVWAWFEPLIHRFALAAWQVMFILAGLIGLSMIIANIVSKTMLPTTQKLDLKELSYTDQLQTFMGLLLLGPVLIAAGYATFIPVFQPTFVQAGSRVNLFAPPRSGFDHC